MIDQKFINQVHDYIRFRYCKKCKSVKAPRTHHCSICGKCVMRMDHHCPWVGNCVGVHTHKFFWTFLFYAFFGTLQASLCMIGNKGFDGMMQEGVAYMFASIISLAFSLSIGGLLAIHTYMLLNNQTTLEMTALTKRNPFNAGTYFKNWAQTFGTDYKKWFFPVPVSGESGVYNGFSFT